MMPVSLQISMSWKSNRSLEPTPQPSFLPKGSTLPGGDFWDGIPDCPRNCQVYLIWESGKVPAAKQMWYSWQIWMLSVLHSFQPTLSSLNYMTRYDMSHRRCCSKSINAISSLCWPTAASKLFGLFSASNLWRPSNCEGCVAASFRSLYFRFNNKSKNCDRWPTNSFTCRMMAFGPRNRGHLLCHVTRYCEAGFSFWFLGVLKDKLPKQHNNSLQSECLYSANHSIRFHEACCWLMAVTLRQQRKQAHCVHNASLLFVG